MQDLRKLQKVLKNVKQRSFKHSLKTESASLFGKRYVTCSVFLLKVKENQYFSYKNKNLQFRCLICCLTKDKITCKFSFVLKHLNCFLMKLWDSDGFDYSFSSLCLLLESQLIYSSREKTCCCCLASFQSLRWRFKSLMSVFGELQGFQGRTSAVLKTLLHFAPRLYDLT